VYEDCLNYMCCGFGFQMDAVYEVYVYPGYALQVGELWKTGVCSETHMIAQDLLFYQMNEDTTKRR